MKIGIYGGTFNPIHLGHMAAAQAAAVQLGLDALYLIPAGTPPHKDMAAGAPSPEIRLEMTELAAEAMELPCRTEVLDLELRREGKSYTVDTVKELKKRCGGAQLFLLMGTDMFLSFQSWRQPEEIAARCSLCAFAREEGDTAALKEQKRRLERELKADVRLIALPRVIEISSTRLREALYRGEGGEYLSPAVYGCILREGLYGVKRDLTALSMEDLRAAAVSMLRHKRVPHVLGTEETAARLALRWGEDEETARRAALLHDCTKKLNGEQHRAIFRQYHVAMDPEEQNEEKLYHAISGAAVARHIFGVSPEMESAIRWHTTGKADMTTLEKIIYLADYIEPTRDFCDLSELRALAFQDLDKAMLLGLEMSIQSLEKRGVAVNSYSVRARDHLKGKQP